MYYQYEWLSDLAIIPAFECFVAGVFVGMLVTLAVIVCTRRKRK